MLFTSGHNPCNIVCTLEIDGGPEESHEERGANLGVGFLAALRVDGFVQSSEHYAQYN
jgi:hypothetical protein